MKKPVSRKLKLKVGDKVRLMSGVPTMTVVRVAENLIDCRWFDQVHTNEWKANGQLFPAEAIYQPFPAKALKVEG